MMKKTKFVPGFQICIIPAGSLLIALTMCVLVSSVMASPITIDSFDDEPGLTGYPQHVGLFGIGSETSEIFGLELDETYVGQRSVMVDTLYPSGNLSGSYGSADLMVDGGKLGLGTNSVVSPYTAAWQVSWSGRPINMIDDDDAPNTGFLIDFLSAEYDCRIVLGVLGAGTTNVASASTTEILVKANSNPHTVFVSFSEFTLLENTTLFDWTNVYQTNIRIYGEADGDYELDAVRASVPEPATLALISAGAGFLFRRRRRA